MTLENIDIIYEWDIEQLWAYVTAYEEELDPIQQQTLNRIKTGFDIKVHINYLTDKHYTEYPEQKVVTIMGKKPPINEFWDEVQTRKKEIRKIIQNLHVVEDVYEGR